MGERPHHRITHVNNDKVASHQPASVRPARGLSKGRACERLPRVHPSIINTGALLSYPLYYNTFFLHEEAVLIQVTFISHI